MDSNARWCWYLCDLISIVRGKGIATKTVWSEFYKIINNFKSEYNTLLKVSFEDLKRVCGERLAQILILNREGKIQIKPGYDGVYGVPIIDDVKTQKIVSTTPPKKVNTSKKGQLSLGDFKWN